MTASDASSIVAAGCMDTRSGEATDFSAGMEELTGVSVPEGDAEPETEDSTAIGKVEVLDAERLPRKAINPSTDKEANVTANNFRKSRRWRQEAGDCSVDLLPDTPREV